MRIGVWSDDYDGPAENHEAVKAIRRAREQLAEDRRHGVGFQTAWGKALAASPPTIRPALETTRAAWEAGYARRDLPRSAAAVARLRDAMPDEREALTTGRVNV